MTTYGHRPVAKVLEPGPFTTVQDSGRFGYRRYGVPLSGAMDLYSLSRANEALGNEPDSPALEAFQGPIAVSALTDIIVGHSGGDAKVSVDGVETDANPLVVRTGSTLRLETRGKSMIVYLAFPGGLMADEVLGSASTYTRGKFGGLNGRTLQGGDLLFASPRLVGPKVRRVGARPEPPELHRVVKGPQADLFPHETLESFFKNEYRVSFASDRMGYRLEGPALQGFAGSGRILTFPVFPGMVQIPPDGQPIVLMADCQTTGGYPVIATVLTPDLCTLAQKVPGARVSFKEVTNEESCRIIEAFNLASGIGSRAGSR